MLVSIRERCRECSGEVIDIGDEFVCRHCGAVVTKEVIQVGSGGAPKAIDFTSQALGGYLGPIEYGYKERFARGLADSPSSFRYLKLVSDYSGREDSGFYACVKMVERVSEKLSLPNIVMRQAATIAKKILCTNVRSGASLAAVSAYALVTACKIEGATSVSVREVLEAHRLLGRKVRASALIRLSLDSPFKTGPRRPEDYLSRAIGRLSSNSGLSERLRGAGVGAAWYFSRLREAALQALEDLSEEGRAGHSPCSLAATAVYAGEVTLSEAEMRKRFITQRDLAECCGVAEYTLREQYGRLFRRAPRPEARRRSRAALPRT